MFITASFHIVKPCNMKCKFCYATFEDMSVIKQLSLNDAKTIIDKLYQGGLEKITFAGGEPTLYKYLFEIIVYSKSLGMTTAIITNGSLIDEEWLIKYKPYLDWIGISIDSLNVSINNSIGRIAKMKLDYFNLISLVHKYNFKLKINTVVNKFNENENMTEFITWANPDRWKIFDTLKVEGQNDKEFSEIKSTSFDTFVNNHKHIKNCVVETNELMTGSYLLIDPQGRLFENSKGKHTYSESLVENPLSYCLNQISLNSETFINRGGIYNW